jgi:pimeloyl-ACP methyl ester carboxylesterase
LLLHGERSPGLFRLLADRLEELLPNARRVEVPGASHIMHEDNPQVVNEAIAGFLRGVSGRR